MTPLLPTLSDSMADFIRIAYGILLFGTLLYTLPQSRRFFMSERWGGYAKSSKDVDAVQNPVVMPLLMTAWMVSAALLVAGRFTLIAAAICLLLARYYFVHMRWKSVVRGLGAPGLMSYWIAAAVFLIELTRRYAPGVESLALLVLQVDFAFIILSAGVYKAIAGYPKNHGMELGMVNPEWGYWWRFFKPLPPGHWVFWTLNQLAWGTEVVSAILMLIPATRFLGGLLIIVSFAFIATQIRLGLLCEMVMVCGLLFAHPGTFIDTFVSRFIVPSVSVAAPVPLLGQILTILCWTYLALLPIAHAGMYFNFYGRKSLPGVLQKMLVAYTNFFGMIIWRVFSVDVVNFFITIEAENAKGETRPVTDWGKPLKPRYNHVAESITVTSLFTTLKYYPSNSAMFRERLLRYAKTIDAPGDVLVFRYFSVTKVANGFEFVPVAEYRVDAQRSSIETRQLDASIDVHAAHAASPVHEGAVPGSYAPLRVN